MLINQFKLEKKTLPPVDTITDPISQTIVKARIKILTESIQKMELFDGYRWDDDKKAAWCKELKGIWTRMGIYFHLDTHVLMKMEITTRNFVEREFAEYSKYTGTDMDMYQWERYMFTKFITRNYEDKQRELLESISVWTEKSLGNYIARFYQILERSKKLSKYDLNRIFVKGLSASLSTSIQRLYAFEGWLEDYSLEEIMNFAMEEQRLVDEVKKEKTNYYNKLEAEGKVTPNARSSIKAITIETTEKKNSTQQSTTKHNISDKGFPKKLGNDQVTYTDNDKLNFQAKFRESHKDLTCHRCSQLGHIAPYCIEAESLIETKNLFSNKSFNAYDQFENNSFSFTGPAADYVFKLLYKPKVDLFADEFNTKGEHYFSLSLDSDRCLGVDAFSHSWKGLNSMYCSMPFDKFISC